MELIPDILRIVYYSCDTVTQVSLYHSCRYWRKRGYKLSVAKKWMTNACIKYDYFPLLRWARDNNCDWCDGGTIGHCVQYLEWCDSNKLTRYHEPCDIAGANGNLDILKWLTTLENGRRYDAKTGEAAASGGHLEVLEWLDDNNCERDQRACNAAASMGYLEVLKWLIAKEWPWTDPTIYGAAAKNGHIAILSYLHSTWNDDHTIGCDWTVNTCYSAAESGQLETLEYLRSSECPWSEELCSIGAASGGHIDILEWIQGKIGRLSEGLCWSAAKNGQLATIQWLVNEKYPIPIDIFDAAIIGGNLELLQWLKEQGCRWDDELWLFATEEQSILVLEWLKDNNCPWNTGAYSIAKGIASEVYYSGISQENAVLNWLDANGYC